MSNLHNRKTTWSVSGEPSLGFVAENTRQILEKNKVEVQGNTGKISGFNPGGYGSIWIDDTMTSLPVAIYFVDREYIFSSLDEHLWRQQEDGELPITLHPGDLTGQKSAASASKVMGTGGQFAALALWLLYQASDSTEFLNEAIRNTSRIQRVDDALSYLCDHRWDQKHGLMTNVYTVDWGDVKTKRGLVDDNNGLCQNAMLVQAAQMLADLWEVVGNQNRAAHWTGMAKSIGTNINRYLWNEAKGFYSPRIAASNCELIFDDRDIFVLGGNTFALQAGVASQEQADRIFASAEWCRVENGGLTISRVNWPDYPPIWRYEPMNHPPHYQNGCYWDWYGGRFVRSEFEHGHTGEAWEHLVQITRHQAQFPDQAFGWYQRDGSDGNPRTSTYTSSTCVVAEAIIYGLFGIYQAAGHLVIQPRLGERSGEICLFSQSNKNLVRYSYHFLRNQLEIDYEMNYTVPLEMRILWPSTVRPQSVLVNDKPVDFNLRNIGRNVYIVFNALPPEGTVRVREH